MTYFSEAAAMERQLPEAVTLELAWRDVGSGAPIVLIHGLGGSSKSWSGVARELRTNHRVLSFDLPGHGNSAAPTSAVTLNDIADAGSRHLQAIDILRPLLVGHSVGGFISLLMARRVRARGLVLIDSEVGVATMTWLHDLARYRTTAGSGGMSALFDVLVAKDPAMSDLLGRRPDLLPTFREAFSSIHPNGFLAVAEAARTRTDRMADLLALGIPTIGVVGSLDTSFLQPTEAFVAKSGGEMVVLQGVGHMPMLERPDLVAAVIARAAVAGDVSTGI